VNGNVKLGRAAARSGEWVQHFSNASCFFTDFSIHTVGLQHVASEQEGLIAIIDMIDYFDVTALRVYTTVHCDTNTSITSIQTV